MQDYLFSMDYWFFVDCLLIAPDAHMFSHNGYGPGTKDQGTKAAGPGPGARSFWARGLGPGPIPIMPEHMCIKGNQ